MQRALRALYRSALWRACVRRFGNDSGERETFSVIDEARQVMPPMYCYLCGGELTAGIAWTQVRMGSTVELSAPVHAESEECIEHLRGIVVELREENKRLMGESMSAMQLIWALARPLPDGLRVDYAAVMAVPNDAKLERHNDRMRQQMVFYAYTREQS